MSKILIVDDDHVTQLYVKRILEKSGFAVECAFDSFEALSKARHNQYAAVIVDLVLPGPKNGIDVIKEIRGFCHNVQILAYSGFSDNDITEKVVYAGANCFLAKPFTPAELIKAIKSNIFINS